MQTIKRITMTEEWVSKAGEITTHVRKFIGIGEDKPSFRLCIEDGCKTQILNALKPYTYENIDIIRQDDNGVPSRYKFSRRITWVDASKEEIEEYKQFATKILKKTVSEKLQSTNYANQLKEMLEFIEKLCDQNGD